MYAIMYQHPGQDAKIVDTVQSQDELAFLLTEYRLAYRGAGAVWSRKMSKREYEAYQKGED